MQFHKKWFFEQLVIFCILVVISVFVYSMARRNIYENKVMAATYSMDLYNNLMNERFQIVIEDLYYLAFQSASYSAIDNGLIFIDKMYKAFVKRKGIYNSITLINTNGQIIADSSKISEKRNIDVTIVSILSTLPDRHVLITSERLNNESGVPVIDFYIPVFTVDNSRYGYIKMEFKFEYMIKLLDENNHQMEFILGITNREGFWLSHIDEKEKFGFADDSRKKYNIAIEYPDLWQSIYRSATGRVVCPKGILLHVPVKPFNTNDQILLPNHVQLNIQYLSTNNNYWNLISYISNKSISYSLHPTLFSILLMDLIIFSLLNLIIYINNTLLKKKEIVERKLNDTMEKYKELLDTIANPVILFDKSFAILYCNKNFLDLLGISKDKVINHKISEFVLDVSNLKLLQEKNDVEVVLKDVIGNYIYTIFSTTILNDGNSEYSGAFCLINDITLLKKERERLVEETYIFENNPGLVFWSDCYGNIIKSNSNGQQIIDRKSGINNVFSIFLDINKQKMKESGYVFEQLINKIYYSVSVKYDFSSNTFFFYCYDISGIKIMEKKLIDSDVLNRTLLNNIPFAMRISSVQFEELYRKEGLHISIYNETFWNAIKLYDTDTNFNNKLSQSEFKVENKYYEIFRIPMIYDGIESILEIIQDITERKKNEDEVTILSIGVEQSANSIVITDEKGSIIYVNTAFEKITGYSKESVIGQNPRLLKSGTHDREFYKNLWTTIKSGKVWIGEFLNKKADNSLYWERAVITPIKDKIGTVINFIAVKEDVTKTRETEDLLKKAKDDAEKDSVLKSEFLANMSHEIRTPMNAIIGFTDILLEEEYQLEKIEKLHMIRKSGSNLLHIINDILDFSKIEAGKVVISSDNFYIRYMCEYAISLFQNKATEKNLGLFLNVDQNVPESVKGDERHITQILINLLGNAIKFTNEGTVLCVVSYSYPNLIIHIIDTGIGINEKKIKTIFNAFEQEDSSTERMYGGTGLGLAISKKLSSLMNGNILVSSESGKGSKFSLIVPVDVITENKEKSDKDVLEKMIDNWFTVWQGDSDMQNILYMAITKFPENIRQLENNINDLNLLKQISHEMKGVFGNLGITELYELSTEIEEICNNSESYDEHRIVAIIEKLKNIQTYLSTLDKKIKNEDDIQTEVGLDNRSIKILVAEDNKINQKLISTLLGKLGYTCDFADNGKIALDKIYDIEYNIVLLDMQMPVIDGLDVIHTIRKDVTLQNLYVIAITAHAIVGDREKYIAEGCNDYLSKPIDKNEFEEKLSKAMVFVQKNIVMKNTKDTLYNDVDIENLKKINILLKENISIFKPSSIFASVEKMSEIIKNTNEIEMLKKVLIESAGSFDEDSLSKACTMIDEIIVKNEGVFNE